MINNLCCQTKSSGSLNKDETSEARQKIIKQQKKNKQASFALPS
jgi:hypothetical protein